MTTILLIDNHDSFTHLLGDLIHRATGIIPRILPNDSPRITPGLVRSADVVIISPGPGSPHHPEDLGASATAIAQSVVPVIGICLGHQAIALAAGATVSRAGHPRHGLASRVTHAGTGIFAGVPSPMEVVRYHSLDVTDPPPVVEVLARADDGTIMALRRTDAPQWGLQFHPESIGTDHGETLLRNIVSAALRHNGRTGEPGAPRWRRITVPESDAPAPLRVADFWRSRYPALIWLDGSWTGGDTETGRPSKTVPPGTGIVAAGRRLVHPSDVPTGRLTEDSAVAAPDIVPGAFGTLTYGASGGRDGTTLAQVGADERLLVPEVIYQGGPSGHHLTFPAGWPADVALGLLPGAAPEPVTDPPPAPVPAGEMELRHDAATYRDLVERCRDFIGEGESYELCLTTTASVELADDPDPFVLFLRLRQLAPAPRAGLFITPERSVLSVSPERFMTVTSGTVSASPIKGTRPRGATPEQDALLARDLASSVKDRAENMMIVDLLRNDLARSCIPGSVTVPELCAVHTFDRVHQLISTVAGRLPVTTRGIDAALAAFPPGSMTGAPKQRSMDILAELEGTPRGVYSGCMGWFSGNGDVDLSVLIRTVVVSGRTLTYGAGGAVTRLSDPAGEWAEVLVKMLPFRLLLGTDTSGVVR
ncbi:chorismate-binding protein [Corynebacterium pygosceleis]|uniref:aminodeoxychorismate synthase n=1 Tax=Corynebacterium pygosceleis TaxID=2800406 RepID=A0A9Q4C8K2_9CORY|nr:chorismate-binding protein [Corynebacterium pygosceleis]MCK7638183.1 chorismate-binding protein [Corynebacterium pygosceleis]MCK7675896.1 chorismate-binding protein [Corynebacterium pygosceleis]MCL0120722.1 chorismate-binding protein [Corynebacterium pygosceleis]MCX7444262.1 chorismate-binding protein [Corynebacterium pygosceleis]MCX7468899.1 chorismate-binding protein [Corynebacterium pygosceleis]